MPRFPMVPLDGGTRDQRMKKEKGGCGVAILVQDTAVLVDGEVI